MFPSDKKRGKIMEWKAASILFADVKGYSSLSEAAMKTFHEKVIVSLDDTLKGLSLRDRNTWGDGIVILSDQVSEICEAALLMRDKFKQINWLKIGVPKLDIRISVHHGEYLEGHDPFTQRTAFCGKTVVTAARIEPVTPPGMVWMTGAAAIMLKQHMGGPADDAFFGMDDVGSITLPKGYGTVEIYALRRGSESAISDSDKQRIRDAEALRLQGASENKAGLSKENETDTFCVLIGIVILDNKVLIVQRRENDEGLDWMFPSAKKLPTDDLKYVIQKEILEETGVHTTYRKNISEVSCHPITKQRCQYIFLEPDARDKAVNGDPMENKNVEWVEIPEALRRIGDNMNRKVAEFLGSLDGRGSG
jgi:class 3 adenylate cyclase/8-oxo-dGTP pyrophosphatase MutT (NUDIX family)